MLVNSSINYVVGAFLAVFAFASSAYGNNHSYISKYRSSSVTHFYVSQGIEGEHGNFKLKGNNGTTSEDWQGYGLINSVGMEVLSFVHFGVSHNFVNMDSKSAEIEKIDGSRFSGDMRFVFQSPLANLQVGGGVIASSLDYQRGIEQAEYYGSGVYYSLGLNYFLTGKVSLYGVAKQNDENIVKSSGLIDINQIKAKTTSMGLGFRVWM